MTIMPDHSTHVIGGVDTHGHMHHAAVIDPIGRHLADREFPATTAGYRNLESWLRSHGTVTAVGIEGTGAYGAELARNLTRSGLTVIEVDRPDRKTRRLRGKSDPIDAYAAAASVTSGIPASTGRKDRHRLNRGGDRAANHALHTIVLCRMRWDERTRAYVERRTQQGLSKKDIMRCLKRYVAREVYKALTARSRHSVLPVSAPTALAA